MPSGDFHKNEKNGKGIPYCNVVVIGELPSGDLLEKNGKNRESVIGEWGVLSIIKSGEY